MARRGARWTPRRKHGWHSTPALEYDEMNRSGYDPDALAVPGDERVGQDDRHKRLERYNEGGDVKR